MLANPAPAQPRTIIHVTSVSEALASPERLDYRILQGRARLCEAQGHALRLAPEGIAVFDVRLGDHPHRYDRRWRRDLRPEDRRRPRSQPGVGERQDVARVVTALARGEFAFATGSVIDADGGLGIPRP